MKLKVDPTYASQEKKIRSLINDFERSGTTIGSIQRNKIKTFLLDGKTVNIKSFKIPNVLNRVVYRFFRKSKAERSFYFAQHLNSKNIGTPQPIAYAEHKSSFSFLESYFISQHLDYDLTFRELVTNQEYSQWEEILRAFTRFTFRLHEHQIEFLDHSPGNTLIQVKENGFNFFLVDLNRMNFRELNFSERMKNFSRLTPKKEMIRIMSNEYAKHIDKPEEEVFEKMWFFTDQFQKKYHRKQALKKKLRFGKF